MADGDTGRQTWGNEVVGSVHNLVQGHSFDNATINFFGTAPRPSLGTPAMLPSRHGPYTDRHAVHERLDRLRERGVGVVQLGGVAGVGKSATAARYLADHGPHYHGGVFYADLGGGRAGHGVSVAEALDGWLTAKGVLPAEVPPGLAARAALFRQLTADAPVAVLIDDAATAAQVESLRPGSPDSLLVVTAHHELPGMRTAYGAEFVQLPMLERVHALDLLTDLVGEDAAQADPAAFDHLVDFSEGHPLMLRVIAGELDRDRWETAGDLARQLADTRRRLVAGGQLMTSGGDYSVNAALDLSISGLPESARALLRLLAANPGPEFGADLVDFLADLLPDPLADGTGLIADLVAAGLVTRLHHAGTPRPSRRWRLHSLVREFVRRQAGQNVAAFVAAEKEIVGWYLRRTAVADRARSPRWHLGPDFADEPRFEDVQSAVTWLEAEHANLRTAVTVAADFGQDETVWQLCEVLWGLYFWSNSFGDWIDTHQLGVETAVRLGDKAAEARIRLQLGFAYFNQDDIEQAAEAFTAALAPAEDCGVGKVLAATLESIGLADLRRGLPEQALAAFARVLVLVGGDSGAGPAAVGNVQRHRARALGALGRPDEAIAVLLDEAIPAYQADGNSRYNLARSMVDLADLLVAAHRPEEAVQQLYEAIAEFGQLRNPLQGAVALTSLASAFEALGNLDGAGDAWDRAAEVYEALGSRKAAEIRSRRGMLGVRREG